jgi:putative FmdB family regulatory protein
MPTYEYECTNCKHAWDIEQKISDATIKTCPKCKKKSAKRLISGGGGFQLRGSNWAKDGYAGKK